MTTRYLNASKTTRRSPNYESGRGGAKITGITIHWWDNPAKAPSFDGVVSWLCNPAAEVSAHFVVQDSRVACLVHPRDKAWCDEAVTQAQSVLNATLEPPKQTATHSLV